MTGFTLTGEMPNLSGDDTQGASMPPSGVAAGNSASTAAATAVKAESVGTSANAVASKTQETLKIQLTIPFKIQCKIASV